SLIRLPRIFLEKFDDHRRDLRRINMPERMNEGRNRRAFCRRIDRAVRATWFALCRATVEFANLLDRLLLSGKTRKLVLFSTVMKNGARFRERHRSHQSRAARRECGKNVRPLRQK